MHLSGILMQLHAFLGRPSTCSLTLYTKPCAKRNLSGDLCNLAPEEQAPSSTYDMPCLAMVQIL